MKEFDTVMRGYDKKQVLKSIDEIIRSYEALLAKSKATEAENKRLFDKLKKYEEIEETLNRLQRLPVSQAIDPHILCIIHPFFDSQHKRLQADRGT